MATQYDSNIGSALMSIGQQLPVTLRTRQQDADERRRKEEEDRRTMAAFALAQRSAEGKLGDEELARTQRSDALGALQGELANRGTANKLAQIDTSMLGKIGESASEDTSFDSEPVDLPESTVADMANERTAGEQYRGMLGRIGGHRLGPNQPVDLALDDARAMAKDEFAAANRKIGGIGVSSLTGSDDPEYVQSVLDQVEQAESSGLISAGEAKVASLQAMKKPTLVNEYLLSLTKPGIQKRQSIPAAADEAAATTGARGGADATTPQFISDQQKQWSAEVKPYEEVIQNYAFAKSGTTGAIDDVALVKALEKVREPNSAVMFQDAEIYRKAGNWWDRAVEGGVIDAIKSGATKTLSDSYRVQLTKLLENAMSVATQKMEAKRAQYIETATKDYNWDAERANRVYRMPVVKAGGGAGSKDASGFKVGDKKYSKKYGRELEYVGDGKWR